MNKQKLVTWLETELKNYERIENGSEKLSDGSEDIFFGRAELAECILNQIDKGAFND